MNVTEIPTSSGFYWWRETESADWRMVQIVDCGGGHLKAYDVQLHHWGGRNLKSWAKWWPVGHWVAVLPPHNQLTDLLAELLRFWNEGATIKATSAGGVRINESGQIEGLTIIGTTASMTQQQIDAWNRAFPVGSPCWVRHDDGSEHTHHTRSPAYECQCVTRSHVVVKVDGLSLAVDLDRVFMASPPAPA